MSFRIMELHSMCHPGRPGPHGDSQVGSPGFADFQSAKSSGLFLRLSTATRSPALHQCAERYSSSHHRSSAPLPTLRERERERVHAETVLMMRQHSEGSISAHSAPVVLLLSPRKAPVVGQRRHIKEHIPFNSIGMAVADDRLDHGDDVIDVLRGLCRSRPVYASETSHTHTHTHTHTQVAIPTVPCVGRSKGTNRSSPEWGMPSTEQHSSMLHMLECFANLNCCHHQVCLLLQDGLRGKEGSRWLQGAQGGPWAPWWGSGIRGAPCLRETHG